MNPAPSRRQTNRVIQTVASWPDVEVGLGKFNSTAFQLADREFGHLHPKLADIGFPEPSGNSWSPTT